MDIGDIATRPVASCGPSTTIEQVARMMRERDIGSVVVVDAAGRPVGIVTDRDLVVRAMAGSRPPTTPVDEVMTREPVTVSRRRDSIDAARHMAERECRRLPVVDDEGALVGIVTLDDLLLGAGHTLDELSRVVAVERPHQPGRLGGRATNRRQ